MAVWLSRIDWSSTDKLHADDLNNLALDDRTWGGNVNGGGYTLSNVVLAGSVLRAAVTVTSVFGRSGDVVAVATDYTPAFIGAVPITRQVIAGSGMTGGGPLNTDQTLSASVTSVFNRIGAVVLTPADITGANGVLNSRSVLTPPGSGLQGGGNLGGPDLSLSVVPDSINQRVQVFVGGTIIGTQPRRAINFVNGANVTISATEDTSNNWVTVQVGSTIPSNILSDPTKNLGDLIVRGPTAVTNLPVGSNGQILTADSTQALGLKWAAAPPIPPVISVFTRTGAVVATAGDYNASQVTNAVDATATYTDPPWIVSVPWAKITNAPSFMVDTLTTKGDIPVNTGAMTTRFPVGADGLVLTADKTTGFGVRWGALPSAITQSPWTGNIDAASFMLSNVKAVGVASGASVTFPLSVLVTTNDAAAAAYSARVTDNNTYLLTGCSLNYNTVGGVGGIAGAPWLQAYDKANGITSLILQPVGSYLGVGQKQPAFAVDVVGDVNCSGVFRQNGVAIPEASQSPWTQDIDGANFDLNNVKGIGIGAKASVTPTNGPITAIAVSAGGAGYTVAPSVTLAGVGSGSGATFTVHLTSGAVSSVTVAAGGSGYPTSGVTATFTGGTFTTAATAGAVTVTPVPPLAVLIQTSNPAIGLKGPTSSDIESIQFQSGLPTDYRWEMGVGYPVAGHFYIRDINASPIRFQIDDAGNVGIGQPPAYPMDVMGDINCTGQYRINGVVLGGVFSFNTRTGAVLPATGDYTAAMVTNAVDVTGSYPNPVWLPSLAWSKITGAPATGVSSFNARTGAIVPGGSDYTVAQIAGAVATSRQILTSASGSGLSGGGNLTGDLSLVQVPKSVNQLVQIYNGGTLFALRAGINFVNSASVSISLNDDSTNNKVDVSMTSSGGGSGGMTDPTTAIGDLIVRGSTTLTTPPGRLAAGTAGQVLTVDSAAPFGVKWATPTTGGGSQTPWTQQIDAASNNLINGAKFSIATVQMPDASSTVTWNFDALNSAGVFTVQRDSDLSKLLLLNGVTMKAEFPIPLAVNTTTAPAFSLDVAGDCNITGVYRVGGVALNLNGLVTSVFGRTGAVVQQAGDYTAAQVTNAVSQIGSYPHPAWITSIAWSIITGPPNFLVDPLTTKGDLCVYTTLTTRLPLGGQGQVLTVDTTVAAGVKWAPASGGVSSFNTRTGAVVPATADYTAAMVTNAVDSTATYANPAWITALAWNKITGTPLTTKGDVQIFGTATTRLPVGTDGQVLTADSTQTLGLKWAAVAAGAAQTPWTSNIDAASHALNNVSNIGIRQASVAAQPLAITTVSSGTDLTVVVNPVDSTSCLGVGLRGVSQELGMVLTPTGYFQTTWKNLAIFYCTQDITFWKASYPGDSSGVELMRLTSTGRLGIGTSTPAYALGVVGDANITGVYRVAGVPIATGMSSFNTRTGAVTSVSGDYTAAQVTNAVSTASTYSDPAWITSLAWSKITGTPVILSDPTTTKGDLIVRGSAAPATRLGVGTDNWVLTADSTQALGVKWAAAPSQTPWTSDINAANFNINSLGNVGIGISGATIPLYILSSGTTNSQLYVKNSNSAGAGGLTLWNDGGSPSSLFQGGSANGQAGWRNNLVIQYQNDCVFVASGGNSERMRITAAGLVGIGKTPVATLDVVNSASGNGSAITASSGLTTGTNYAFIAGATGAGATNNTGVYVSASGATSSNIGVRIASPPAGANNWALFCDSAAPSSFTGPVGIGINIPGCTLQVNGQIGVNGVPSAGRSFGLVNPTALVGFSLTTNGVNWYVDHRGTTDAPNNRFTISSDGGATFTLTNNGLCGIQIANPGYTLHVNGNFYSASGVYSGGIIYSSVPGSLFGTPSGSSSAPTTANTNILLYNNSTVNWAGIGADGSGNMYFRVGGSGSPLPAMTLLAANQFVGIGTNAPGSQVTIIPASNYGAVALVSQFAIGESSNNGAYRLNLGYFNDGSWKGFVQAYQNSAGAALLLNPGGGPVGVNTSAPNYALTVNGTIALYAPSQNYIRFESAAQGSGWMIGRSLNANDANDFFIYNQANGAVAISIVNSNVGIGLTAGAPHLTVNTNGYSNPVAGQVHGGVYFTPGGWGMQIGHYASGDTWIQEQRDDGNGSIYNILLQPIGGGVGIGMQSGPSYNLQLANDSAGKPSANWTVTSDVRTKRNIRPYLEGLETLLQLHPTVFEYNGEAQTQEGLERVGLVAQDVADVIPTCVEKIISRIRGEETEVLALNTSDLTWMILNALREIDKRLREAKL